MQLSAVCEELLKILQDIKKPISEAITHSKSDIYDTTYSSGTVSQMCKRIEQLIGDLEAFNEGNTHLVNELQATCDEINLLIETIKKYGLDSINKITYYDFFAKVIEDITQKLNKFNKKAVWQRPKLATPAGKNLDRAKKQVHHGQRAKNT
ncbi:MAG: hypothetical protein HC896_09925 [Bacteroidales bacterium]|nr:hypothetical protein [Bacteroidales bacterium]